MAACPRLGGAECPVGGVRRGEVLDPRRPEATEDFLHRFRERIVLAHVDDDLEIWRGRLPWGFHLLAGAQTPATWSLSTVAPWRRVRGLGRYAQEP
jgi:hypothetical protein